MKLGKFHNLRTLHRAQKDITSSIRICRDDDDEDNQTIRRGGDLDSVAIPFGNYAPLDTEANGEVSGRSSSAINSSISADYSDSSSLQTSETSTRSCPSEEEGEEESFNVTVAPTAEEREEEDYKLLSSDFGVMVNENFNPKRDYCSLELWSLLERLSLPETKRYLLRYIRHCTFVAETWLARIVRYHTAYSSKAPDMGTREVPEFIMPLSFDATIRPLIEQIVRKVRRRRWRCSVSKKYLDSLCTFTLCPTFSYNVRKDQSSERHSEESLRDGFREGVTFPSGALRVFIPSTKSGDPFRRVSKEVSISSDWTSESLDLVPLLWQLELRLVALLYLHSDWVHDETTIRCFPHLGDSRVLFSIYKKEECERPILSYNISQIRSALGRLYTRWNDLAPSQDLYHYVCFLRDRISLLSISSLCSTIKRQLSLSQSGSSSSFGSLNEGGGRRGRGSAATTRTPLVKSIHPGRKTLRREYIPDSINPIYAFGKYIGNNLKNTVESITNIPLEDLDLALSKHTEKSIHSILSKNYAGGDTLTSEVSEDLSEFNAAVREAKTKARLRKAEKRATREERLLIRQQRQLYTRLIRKQKLSQIINSKIEENNASTFTSIAESADYRGEKITSSQNYAGNRNKDHPFLGDVDEEPPIVTNKLRKLGGDIFSSSEDDSHEFLDSDEEKEEEEEEGIGQLSIKKKKGKGRKHDDSTASGSAAHASKIAPTDESFFQNYVERDERAYSQLGEVIKDEDICSEVITHHLIASIKNDGKRGTENHPRISSDAPASFSNIFLSCLTTDGFLTTTTGEKNTQKTVKCITRTNESFLSETHAMLSQIEQEIQTWSMLDTIITKKEQHVNEISCAMSWKHSSPFSMQIEEENVNLSLRGILPKGLSEPYESDPIALLEYAIEFERCKIENVLKMCYSFSRGKRNQFISRNIREVSFCHFLNPGEPEFLLQVCGLKNSSIMPSIIVSRLRQNDVDRLAKIIDEMTVYNIIEEFAEFNELNLREKNIASHNHGKYLFYSRGFPDSLEEYPPDEQNNGETAAIISERCITPTEIDSLIQHLSGVSIKTTLDAHLTETLTPSHFFDGRDDTHISGEEKENFDHHTYSIFPSRAALRKMYKHDGVHRFLSPDVSVPWQSPRGLVRVIRVILFRCINFYMKEISHLIDARSFFFNSWMTIKLCNNPTFVKLHTLREEIIIQTQKSHDDHLPVEEGELDSEEEEEGEQQFPRIPTREEIASLFSSSSSCSKSTDNESERMEEMETMDNIEREEEEEEEEEIAFLFSPELTACMRSRVENYCMNFYFRCPVVLQCMSGCFLWNPSTCRTEECLGADSLLGIHTWLYEMTRHISASLIPELLAQNAFYLESGKSDTWIITDRSKHDIIMDDNNVETLAILYASTHNTYDDSTYPDNGMHYKHLLMLLSNMVLFGNRGVYSTMVEKICIFVIQMNVMLFPHILETFSIHIQGESNMNASPNEKTEGEELPRAELPYTTVQKSIPTDPTIQYVEHASDSNEEGDMFESVSIYYPKNST